MSFIRYANMIFLKDKSKWLWFILPGLIVTLFSSIFFITNSISVIASGNFGNHELIDEELFLKASLWYLPLILIMFPITKIVKEFKRNTYLWKEFLKNHKFSDFIKIYGYLVGVISAYALAIFLFQHVIFILGMVPLNPVYLLISVLMIGALFALFPMWFFIVSSKRTFWIWIVFFTLFAISIFVWFGIYIYGVVTIALRSLDDNSGENIEKAMTFMRKLLIRETYATFFDWPLRFIRLSRTFTWHSGEIKNPVVALLSEFQWYEILIYILGPITMISGTFIAIKVRGVRWGN